MNPSAYDTQKQRGHIRSASLENANAFMLKNTIGLPIIQPGCTGTLKSRNEQKRLRNKFGSHNNLDDYVIQSKSKFQNLRKMFETNKSEYDSPVPQQQQQQQRIYQHVNSGKPNAMECSQHNLSIVEGEQQQQQHRVNCDESADQPQNLLRPIAFKPIPFEPDYSIPNRYSELCDRYGSTPSLAPMPGANMKFGSTSDLRHGYSSNSYCSSLLARRRYSRSFKINDSMESVRHTPDLDAISQNSTIKSSHSNKFMQDQFDMTPSPSDSGISDLEAALKDRDSELSYLRQTMEHNEKVIFKVHKDKEVYWEMETKRLKAFYDNQQREYMLKIKKLEQMLTLQSFQFKQNKLRICENSNKLKEQYSDLKSENDLLRNETEGLKTTERTMRDRVNQLEEKISVMDKLIANLKNQLEENEWTVCQKNGEIALLKTQLKESNMELTQKEHELVHVRNELQTEPPFSLNCHTQPEIEPKPDSAEEVTQLNRIIILKDQVILALTSELGKLRKELSDLAIFHEYGEEPSGKLSRLKYKIDNLTDLCSNKPSLISDAQPKATKTSEENDLEIIINCLRASGSLAPDVKDMKIDPDSKLTEISTTIQNFVFGTNLPDVTIRNLTAADCELSNNPEIELLRAQLDEMRKNFENERRQWAEEKEKVLKYQQQLQMHYINMYQKMKELDKNVA